MSNIANRKRKVALICSHGGLDEAYPSLILANAARQSGIDAFVFFTFWGLDIITESRSITCTSTSPATPARGCPPCSPACRAWRALAAKMMKKQMEELELPTCARCCRSSTSRGPSSTPASSP
jgi:peroxiredoxin family protein